MPARPLQCLLLEACVEQEEDERPRA
jgi:hypothetical protein